jgi:large repetitive protein
MVVASTLQIEQVRAQAQPVDDAAGVEVDAAPLGDLAAADTGLPAQGGPVLTPASTAPPASVAVEPVPNGVDHGGLDLHEVVAQERAAVDVSRAGKRGFDPVLSVEDVSQRSQFAAVFDNPDGSTSATIAQIAQHYRAADGSWERIDARLRSVGGEAGVFESTANSFTVRADRSGVTITTGKGSMVRLSPSDAPGGLPAPILADDGLSVTYPQVWPGVDVRFRVSNAAVTKEIVLTGPGTAASFDLAVSGVEVVTGDDGALMLSGGAADEMAIGQVEILDRRGAPITAAARPTQSSVSRRDPAGRPGSTLTVGVDPVWLAELPAAAFPIVIDPQITIGNLTNWSYAYTENGWWCPANPTCARVRVGNSAALAGGTNWRSFFAYDYMPYLPTGSVASQLFSAQLNVQFHSGDATTRWLAVRRASSYAWCGLWDQGDADPANRNCAGSPLPAVTQFVGTGATSFDVTSQLLPFWQAGFSNVPWGFNGEESPSVYTYKELYTSLTVTFDRTPYITSMSPGNGYTQHGSEFGLVLSAGVAQADPDGQATWYRFWLCQNPDFNNCQLAPRGDSGWTTASTWWAYQAGTAGLTAWFYNKQLYWAVQVAGTNAPGATDVVLNSGWHAWKLYNNSIASVPLVSPGAAFSWSPPATVTLVAQRVDDPDADALWYRFVVRENGAVGVAVRSEWIAVGASDVSWQIPANAPLVPGLVYEWSVEWQDKPTRYHYYFYQGAAQAVNPVAIDGRFAQRFGSSGPSPFQAVGPFSLNLANSNLYTSIPTVSQSTATGTLGAALEYNSIKKDTGLRGRYVGVGGAILERVDPTINFQWATGGPSPAFPVDSWNATWTGWITVPTSGPYTFGAGADNSARVTVSGLTVLDQTGANGVDSPIADQVYYLGANGTLMARNEAQVSSAIGTYTSITLTAGVPVPIQVDYTEVSGSAHLAVYYNLGGAAFSVVPSDWLSPASRVLSAWLFDDRWGLIGIAC